MADSPLSEDSQQDQYDDQQQPVHIIASPAPPGPRPRNEGEHGASSHHRHHHHHHHHHEQPQHQQQSSRRRPYRRKRARCACACCAPCDTCTCCGTCPLGCTTWLSELNKVWIVFLALIFCVTIIWFAGSGASLFEQADGHQLWSSWYRCRDSFVVNSTTKSGATTTTTVSTATASLLGVVIGRDYKCTTTYLDESVWPCAAVATRMNQLGGLQLSGFFFLLTALILTVCHMARRWRFPCLPFFFTLIAFTEGVGICALTYDLFYEPQCSGAVGSFYPLFNTSLSFDNALQLGGGYGAQVTATVLLAIALVVLLGLWCCPDGPPRKHSEVEGAAARSSGAPDDPHDDVPHDHDDDDEVADFDEAEDDEDADEEMDYRGGGGVDDRYQQQQQQQQQYGAPDEHGDEQQQQQSYREGEEEEDHFNDIYRAGGDGDDGGNDDFSPDR